MATAEPTMPFDYEAIYAEATAYGSSMAGPSLMACLAEVERLRGRVAELEAGLRPFARCEAARFYCDSSIKCGDCSGCRATELLREDR